MSSFREQTLNLIFVFITTAALGVLLGLSVLRTVDQRMSDISINIPTIKVPSPQVKLEWPNELTRQITQTLTNNYRSNDLNNNMTGGYYDQHIAQELANNIETDNQIFKRHLPKDFNLTTNLSTLPITDQLVQDPESTSCGPNYTICSPDFRLSKDYQNNQNYYLADQQLESHKVSNYMPIHQSKANQDIDHYQTNRHHLKIATKKSRHCTPHQLTDSQNYYDQPCSSKQHYKDLAEMTDRQIIKFKKYAKFDKMTVRDYINWLSLYINEPKVLSKQNQQNLKKLKRHQPIKDCDIPKNMHYPKTSKEYYHSMYDNHF